MPFYGERQMMHFLIKTKKEKRFSLILIERVTNYSEGV